MSTETLLEVENLSVHFPTGDGLVKAVDGLSFTVNRGDTFGIVGESGSGKSVTNLTALGLTDRKSANITGEVLFKGRDLLKLGKEDLRKIRGKEMAMIFQDPFSCLHPFYRVGDQIVEAILCHDKIPKKQAEQRTYDLLGAVGIPKPTERFRDFPHQYSGGMRQRAMIAMAMAHNPDLLIADEPTTALDVTVQAQILELIDRVKTEFNIGVILITHDLGVVSEV
ncbi:MAG: ABC transporter ATP-binding protein, partial [Actinomycetota bacterium]